MMTDEELVEIRRTIELVVNRIVDDLRRLQGRHAECSVTLQKAVSAAFIQARAEERGRCAKVADDCWEWAEGAQEIARRIRALK